MNFYSPKRHGSKTYIHTNKHTFKKKSKRNKPKLTITENSANKFKLASKNYSPLVKPVDNIKKTLFRYFISARDYYNYSFNLQRKTIKHLESRKSYSN